MRGRLGAHEERWHSACLRGAFTGSTSATRSGSRLTRCWPSPSHGGLPVGAARRQLSPRGASSQAARPRHVPPDRDVQQQGDPHSVAPNQRAAASRSSRWPWPGRGQHLRGDRDLIRQWAAGTFQRKARVLVIRREATRSASPVRGAGGRRGAHH